MDYKAIINDKLGPNHETRCRRAVALADKFYPNWLESGNERMAADSIMQELLTEDAFGRMPAETNEELTDWIVEWFLMQYKKG